VLVQDFVSGLACRMN